MNEIANILLAAGTLGAGFYCMILSHRLRRFTDLEKGVGGAVAVLSAQVDDLSRTLTRAQAAANASVSGLAATSDRAEAAGKRLELLMAALHDLPETSPQNPPVGPHFIRHPEAVGRRA